MTSVFLVAALVAAGGRMTFTGAVTTPTLPKNPIVALPRAQIAARIAAQSGRFRRPWRDLRIGRSAALGGAAEVVVTFD